MILLFLVLFDHSYLPLVDVQLRFLIPDEVT